jgi:hypothetical protein
MGMKIALFSYGHCRIDTEPTRLRPGGTRAAPNQDSSLVLFFGEMIVLDMFHVKILSSTDACDG